MSTPSSPRPTWLAIVILTAIVGSAVIGGLVYAMGASALASLATAGAAFTAIAGLGMKMVDFLTS